MLDIRFGVCAGVRKLTADLRNAVDWDGQREPRWGMAKIFEIQL